MRSRFGFTLIELLIVVAIVAILAAIAIPSYQAQVRQSRRAEGIQLLQDYALRQERWRADNPSYGTTAQVTLPANTAFYTFAQAAAPTGLTFSITATGLSTQAHDTGCTVMTITQTGLTPAICKK